MACSSLRKIFNFHDSVIDNVVFRLHYKLTLPILLLLSIIVGVRQYFGGAINCQSSELMKGYGLQNIIDDFCYADSTFSVVEAWKHDTSEVPYPGVNLQKTNETRIYHHYYKWVSLVLFIQSVLFFIPRYFWKAMECGQMNDLVSVIKKSAETPTVNLQDPGGRRYFAFYLAAEVLNVVNVIGQIFLMNAFLGGAFLTYGADVLGSPMGYWKAPYDPMLRLFPRITNCVFKRYGASGLVQGVSTMCLLPINILNEKIYLFLWFWFLTLAILSCLAVLYRLLILISPQVRLNILVLRTQINAKGSLQAVSESLSVGEWFVLYLLSKNLRPSGFRHLVSVLAENKENDDMKLKDITIPQYKPL